MVAQLSEHSDSIGRALKISSVKNELVAQLVEQYTFNVWALGSSPSQFTKLFQIWKQLFYFRYMPYCYILFSPKLNKYYVGACIDLDRRFHEHNIGHSKFTSTGTPWELVNKEEYDSLFSANQRESKIKSMKSRKFIINLIQP